MDWKQYAIAAVLFNFLGLIVVYLLQRVQQWLPLNPAALANVSPDSSFNTALSFVTNTNWQGYAGEATMSYLTQMLHWRCRTSSRPPPASRLPSR
jgi:K+-transporting ATPase ATPase A chain